VANYNVDIAVALKGAKELTSFNKTVKNTTQQIEGLNQRLKNGAKDQKLLVKSFDNLNEVLSKAKKNFNAAASGTNLQKKAARQLIATEKQLNKEYMQRENLLNRLRGTGKMPLPGTGVGRDPVASSIERRRRKLMRGANTYSSPIGPVQASPLEMIPGFGMGSYQGQSSPVGDKIARALQNEKNLVKEVEAIRQRASERRASNTKRQAALEKQSHNAVKKAIKEEAELRKQADDAANKSAQKRRAFRQKIGNISSNAIIGGGFPLLFGQGPTAALGGALGGAAGGLVGGQFGFALSIAGTAIGSALDDLANALAKPTENIEKLIEKFGLTGTETGDLASELEKLGLKSAAATLLLEKGKEKFGLTTDEIKKNTKQLEEFKNSINILGTELTLFLSDALQPIINDLLKFRQGKGITKGIVDFILFGPGGNPVSKERIRGKQGRKMSNIPVEEGNAIIGEVKLNPDFEKNPNLDPLQERVNNLKEIAKFNKDILPLQQALEIEQQRLSLTNDELSILKAKNNLDKAERTLKVSKQELQISFNTLGSEELKNLEEKIRKERILVDTAKAALTNAENAKKINDMKNQASLADLDNRIKLQKESLTLLPKELNILQQKNKLSSLESALDIAKAENNQSKVNNLLKQIELQNILIQQAEILANPIQAEMIMLDQQMKQLNDVGERVVGLSRTIGSSFQESFKGVIMGTMSVTDAFRNMTNRIADYFLDMAARMMANQLQRGILGIFGGMFGGGATDVFAGFNRGPTNPNNLTMNSFANGGRPPVGRPSVVGERGPELFVPDRKGTIIPNHALGGSTNVTVNVDASGSSVEGDAGQAEQLGEAISQAIQAELIQQKRPGGILYN